MDDIDRLFRDYHQPVVRYLARRLGDRDLAEELAQETFLRAMRHLPLTNERSWLFSVATNLIRDEGRRETRRRRHLDALRNDESQTRTIEHESVTQEQRQDQLREQAFARSAIDALGEKDRAALLLREEGLDYHEIAATLGLSVGSVGTTLSRARRRLVDIYESLVRERDTQGGADVA